MNVHIRSAGVLDAPIVAELGSRTFAQTFGYLFERRPADLTDYLTATFNVAKIGHSIHRPENQYWIAFADDVPIGYAKLKYPSPHELVPQMRAAQLQKIYVDVNHLGGGVGEPLLNAVHNRACDLHARAMWLVVLSENARARRFYEKHGFARCGQSDFAIGTQTFRFDVLQTDLT